MRMKLDSRDEDFLRAPQGATVLFAGTSGTETWIERDRDLTVEIGIRSVGIATADSGCLTVSIEVGDHTAKGLDGGVSEAAATLRASQSVQVLVKAGERLTFKAFPTPSNCRILRTTVFVADSVKPAANSAQASSPARGSNGAEPGETKPQNEAHQ